MVATHKEREGDRGRTQPGPGSDGKSGAKAESSSIQLNNILNFSEAPSQLSSILLAAYVSVVAQRLSTMFEVASLIPPRTQMARSQEGVDPWKSQLVSFLANSFTNNLDIAALLAILPTDLSQRLQVRDAVSLINGKPGIFLETSNLIGEASENMARIDATLNVIKCFIDLGIISLSELLRNARKLQECLTKTNDRERTELTISEFEESVFPQTDEKYQTKDRIIVLLTKMFDQQDALANSGLQIVQQMEAVSSLVEAEARRFYQSDEQTFASFSRAIEKINGFVDLIDISQGMSILNASLSVARKSYETLVGNAQRGGGDSSLNRLQHRVQLVELTVVELLQYLDALREMMSALAAGRLEKFPEIRSYRILQVKQSVEEAIMKQLLEAGITPESAIELAVPDDFNTYETTISSLTLATSVSTLIAASIRLIECQKNEDKIKEGVIRFSSEVVASSTEANTSSTSSRDSRVWEIKITDNTYPPLKIEQLVFSDEYSATPDGATGSAVVAVQRIIEKVGGSIAISADNRAQSHGLTYTLRFPLQR
jgi:hypothetical protein